MMRTYYPSGSSTETGGMMGRTVMNLQGSGDDRPAAGVRHNVGDVGAYVALGTVGVALGGMAVETVASLVRALRGGK